MKHFKKIFRIASLTFVLICITTAIHSQKKITKFKVLAFFTARVDQAHISFVKEANQWFSQMSRKHQFTYDTTSNWTNLNDSKLSEYQVLLFLDSRTEDSSQRNAFKKYMENGGGWMGFHFAGFALTPSAFPQNWDWYHNQFIGAGEYVSNTWRPTAAILQVEYNNHPSTKNLPVQFKSSPNEWYRWQHNLRDRASIRILLSIHPLSFPLGTGPKPHEIWHSGDYPVAWSNTDYRMIYMNMGHNDMDYENKCNRQLSYTFQNPVQNQFILDSILWLGTSAKTMLTHD